MAFFLTITFISLIMDVCWSMSACSTDKDCPKEHMVCRLNVNIPTTQSHLGPGVCGCKDDWVAWKWECHPPVTLGEACLTTVQCQANNESRAVCNPITRNCDCEPGYVKKLKQERTITCSTNITSVADKPMNNSQPIIAIFKPDKALARPKRPPSLEPPSTSKERTYSAIEKAVNLAVERHRGEQPTVHTHQARTMDPTIFIAVSLVLVGFGGIVTVVYIKSMHEKKTSQAAVRSLLNMMAEQDQLQRSYSINNGYNTGNSYNAGNGFNNNMKRSETSDSLKTNVTDVESVTEARQNNPPQYTDIARPRPRPMVPIFDHGSSLPSKITLVPLEGEHVLRFPSPHLSNPKLPPIKGLVLSDLRQESQQTLPLSVATFPEEDPPSYTDLLR